MPDANNILNLKDIESDLIKLKDEAIGVEAEAIEEEEEEEKIEEDEESEEEEEIEEEEIEEDEVEEEIEEEEEIDYNSWTVAELKEYCEENDIEIPSGAKKAEIIELINEAEASEEEEEYDVAEEYGLESFGISINKVNTVYFAIGMYSLFEREISDIVVTKNISEKFENVKIIDVSIGNAELEGNQIKWTITELDPEVTALIKFTADILVNTKDSVKTGTIEVSYKGTSSFTGGLEIENFDGLTNNKHYIDIIERDEEPGVWDCRLVFENPSEFKIDLFKIDIHTSDEPDTNFIDLGEVSPKLPAGAQWNSDLWQYYSDDYPTFQKEIYFRVFSEIEADVNGTIAIEDVDLVLASITGEVIIEEPEVKIPTEEEGVILLPSYKESDIPTTLKYVNDGSAPINEVKITQKRFDDKFRPPEPDEVEVLKDGKPIDVDPENILIDDNSVQVILPDLKDSPIGMLEPDSVIEVKYPIHADNPPQDAEFVTDVIYNGNTYPLGQELEYIPEPEEIPIIKVVHVRRKFRLGKKITPIGALGSYQIVIEYENLGNMPLKDYTILDKVPDNFEYGEFSLEPEITDEKGSDTLKWSIEELEEGNKIEISYEINGSGEYRPSDAQLLH
ncbi:MAG: hypothetical protein EU540_00590 [Promethearchaeota archaeon]|nr:MAG: hypothetical protein EU540_00590 [Candidatus Lokiarchaeota archaeon]